MNILTQNNQQSMTSQQIADLVEKRHDSVKRTIDFLVKDNAIQLPHHAEVKNHLGQSVMNYVFSGDQGRLDSIVVVAQLSPKFTAALVKRWDELENQASKPAMPALPQSFSEALLLAGTLQQQIEQDAPKVAHFNAVADRKTLLNATQVAHSVGLKSPQALNTKLDLVGVYNKSVKRGKAFKAWFIEQGLGEMKQGNTGHMQPLFTTRGQVWVYELLSREGAF